MRRVLVVGNGGREHALIWKFRRDAPDAEIFVTRGNGGTDGLATAIPLAASEIQALAGWAEQERIDITVVGPEIPLAAGIVDLFGSRGLPIFGPTRDAAEIESSKAFAKRLMKDHDIPTAAFETFAELHAAENFIRARGAPIVVKASGLAAGKGAVVCHTVEEGLSAARTLLEMGTGDPNGPRLVVEEFMEGEELSVLALTDGEAVLPLLPAQDHKRIGVGDTGPNTGGMGAYAPVSIATHEVMDEVVADILLPTLRALRDEGRPFTGVLYAGLMLTPSGPRVVEFNCRFGDPETQAILPLLDDSLLDVLGAIARGEGLGRWDASGLRWRSESAVTTVLAAGGYPAEHRTGLPIEIPGDLEAEGDVVLFHAGTRRDGETLLTAGGRVLAVTALGRDVRAAAERSREAAARIHFQDRYFRGDIGNREITRAG